MPDFYNGQIETGTFTDPTDITFIPNGVTALTLSDTAAAFNVSISTTITTVTLSSTENDYPTLGLSVLRIDGGKNITGFADGVDGKILTIMAVNSVQVILYHLDSGSISDNQMNLGNAASTIYIDPDNCVTLQYDAVDLKWRLISKSF